MAQALKFAHTAECPYKTCLILLHGSAACNLLHHNFWLAQRQAVSLRHQCFPRPLPPLLLPQGRGYQDDSIAAHKEEGDHSLVGLHRTLCQ